MLRIQFLLFVLLLCNSDSILAQERDTSKNNEVILFQIKGKVIDAKKTPLDFATVVLLSGDTMVGGAKTDQRGNFILDKIKSGRYNLRFSYAGYMTSEIQSIILKSNLDLEQIELDKKIKKEYHGMIHRGCNGPNPRLINRDEPNQKIILRKEMKQMGFY